LKVGADFASTGFSVASGFVVSLTSSTGFDMPKVNFGVSTATGGLIGLGSSWGGDVACFVALNDVDPPNEPNLNPPFIAGFSPFEDSWESPPIVLCDGGRLNWNFDGED